MPDLPTTRYPCPIGSCAWHHDATDNPVVTEWAGSFDATVLADLAAHIATVDDVVRLHLEAHPLIEWVGEVRRQRARADAAESERDQVLGAVGAAADFNDAMNRLTALPSRSPADIEVLKAGLLNLSREATGNA